MRRPGSYPPTSLSRGAAADALGAHRYACGYLRKYPLRGYGSALKSLLKKDKTIEARSSTGEGFTRMWMHVPAQLLLPRVLGKCGHPRFFFFLFNPDPPPSDYHALQAGHWRWGCVSLGGTHRRVYISRGGGHCSLSTPFSLWLPSQNILSEGMGRR